eukprot:g16737.t1
MDTSAAKSKQEQLKPRLPNFLAQLVAAGAWLGRAHAGREQSRGRRVRIWRWPRRATSMGCGMHEAVRLPRAVIDRSHSELSISTVGDLSTQIHLLNLKVCLDRITSRQLDELTEEKLLEEDPEVYWCLHLFYGLRAEVFWRKGSDAPVLLASTGFHSMCRSLAAAKKQERLPSILIWGTSLPRTTEKPASCDGAMVKRPAGKAEAKVKKPLGVYNKPVSAKAWAADRLAREKGRVQIFNSTRPNGLDGWTMDLKQYNLMRTHILNWIKKKSGTDGSVALQDVVNSAQERYQSHALFPKGRLTNYEAKRASLSGAAPAERSQARLPTAPRQAEEFSDLALKSSTRRNKSVERSVEFFEEEGPNGRAASRRPAMRRVTLKDIGEVCIVPQEDEDEEDSEESGVEKSGRRAAEGEVSFVHVNMEVRLEPLDLPEQRPLLTQRPRAPPELPQRRRRSPRVPSPRALKENSLSSSPHANEQSPSGRSVSRSPKTATATPVTQRSRPRRVQNPLVVARFRPKCRLQNGEGYAKDKHLRKADGDTIGPRTRRPVGRFGVWCTFFFWGGFKFNPFLSYVW